MTSASSTHVVIVGAGPYGLSLAAHLQHGKIPFRIFGQPMQSWASQMPAGMKLKSDGFASNLSSPGTPFTLEDFCRLTGRPYHATDLPVAVEDFVAYGREFQRRLVPGLEFQNVASVEPEGDLLRITLTDGVCFFTRNVVVATGVSLFQHIPDTLAHLPAALVSHSTDHRSFESFIGQDVTVLGRGASSLNAAALLHECGARPTIVSRHRKIHVHEFDPPGGRSPFQRFLHPSSPLGSSLRSWLSCVSPATLRRLPFALRRALTYKHLGPAGGVSLQGRIEGRMPILAGWHIVAAELVPREIGANPRVRLTLRNAAGQMREHTTAHVIAGTGFRYQLSRLRFLSSGLLDRIRTEPTGAPALGAYFEASVPNLYFIGPVASTSFGPLLRFAAGAGYAAPRLAGHFQRELALEQLRQDIVQHKPISLQAFDRQPVQRTAGKV